MKTDFEKWLAAQFADTGAFTIFIVLVRTSGEQVAAVKSTYAQMIGDDMSWVQMVALLDGARTSWDAVAFFVGLPFTNLAMFTMADGTVFACMKTMRWALPMAMPRRPMNR